VLAICYEDYDVMLGGMGRHVHELYRFMARRNDVRIDLLTAGPGEGGEQDGYRKFTTDKLICYKPKGPDLSSYLFTDIQAFRTMTRLLAEGRRWDVVHIHDWNTVQLGRAMRDALGIPLVATMHLSLTHLGDTDIFFPKPRRIPQEYLYCMQQEGHLVSDSNELIVCSRAQAKIISETFMVYRPMCVIPNGIDLDEWRPANGDGERARSQHHLPEREVALFVGRIADMKGVRAILNTVEAEDNGYCVVLVGEVNADTEEQKEAWEVTRKIRLLEGEYPERIRWVGFRKGAELLDLYACAAVGLMPSLHEPFGIVALEHMAMGVPLICTEVEGLGEVVAEGDEEFAMIVRPNSSEDLNLALAELRDTKKREELIHSGLDRVKSFEWPTVAAETMGVYRSTR